MRMHGGTHRCRLHKGWVVLLWLVLLLLVMLLLSRVAVYTRVLHALRDHWHRLVRHRTLLRRCPARLLLLLHDLVGRHLSTIGRLLWTPLTGISHRLLIRVLLRWHVWWHAVLRYALRVLSGVLGLLIIAHVVCHVHWHLLGHGAIGRIVLVRVAVVVLYARWPSHRCLHFGRIVH